MQLKTQPTYQLNTKELNYELGMKGIILSEEEIKQLTLMQKIACEKFALIETDNKRLEKIISPFIQSPFMGLNNYNEIFKGAIYLYYHVRSKFDWKINDDYLCEVIFHEYLKYFGQLDKDITKIIIKRLKKEIL